MPTPIPPGMRLGVVAPRDAIAAFDKRKLLQPSFHWLDVFQEEHARAFTVAGVQKLDLLQVFRDELDRKFAEAGTLADFRKAMRPELVKRGWWGDVEITDPGSGEIRTTTFDNRRLKLIYDTNVRQSYAAGRWARIEANKARQPFVIYKTMDDAYVRAQHRPWHNLVLPVDHPFWNQHYPPCDWGCRCHAFALSEGGIEKLKKSGQKLRFEAPPEQLVPFVNPRTGEVAAVPRGVAPAFAYNPGKVRDASLYEMLLRKAMGSDAWAGAVVVAQAQADNPAMVAQAAERFAAWFDVLRARGQAIGEMQHVGVIPSTVIRELERRGAGPQGAVISVTDESALHAIRDAKTSPIDLGLYRRLPELLQRASAVLREPGASPQVLLYVVDLMSADGSVSKLVVQLDQVTKVQAQGKRSTMTLNVVRTATVLDPRVLGNSAQYELLWGRL